jgi:hypothetical protein
LLARFGARDVVDRVASSYLPAYREFLALLPIPFVLRLGHAQPLHQVLAHSKCVGHDGKRRIDGCARRKETPIHNIEIVDIVRLTVWVEN